MQKFNERKIMNPSGMKGAMTHSNACDKFKTKQARLLRKPVYEVRECICGTKTSLQIALSVPKLLMTKEWQGSSVEVNSEGNTVLRHPNGSAVITLYTR